MKEEGGIKECREEMKDPVIPHYSPSSGSMDPLYGSMVKQMRKERNMNV